MIITNKSGLPQSFINAASYAWYDSPTDSDITVTRMIKTPRIVNLFKRHQHEIEVDAQELVWSILGSSIHVMLERSAGEDVIVEKRLSTNIKGWNVSGKPDAFYPKKKSVIDYKVTSVWSFLSEKPEWEAQLNLNAMLHRLHRQDVDSITILAILKDWSRTKADVTGNYPQFAVQQVGFPLWTLSQQKEYALERITLHQAESSLPDEELTLCSPDERWYRGGGWAVYKKGNKRADKVLNTKEKAIEYMQENPLPPAKVSVKTGKMLKPAKEWDEIRERKGQNIRCLFYCESRSHCDFAKSLVNENQDELELEDEATEHEVDA